MSPIAVSILIAITIVVIVVVSIWLTNKYPVGRPGETNPLVERRFCLYCWLMVVTIMGFASIFTLLANSDDPPRIDGCNVTVPYGQRITIACAQGEG